MVKSLLEVYGGKKTRSKNRGARGKGSRAEGLLLRELTEIGYEVRMTHLSLFPDIIAWNENELLMIEVKQRANTKTGISNALSMFRSSSREVTKWHKGAKVLCYLRVNDSWRAFEWKNNVTEEVSSIV